MINEKRSVFVCLIGAYSCRHLCSWSALAVSTLDPMSDGEYAKFGYEIDSYLGHALDMIVDLGEEKVHEETTVFELADGEINVIREGVGDITSFKEGSNNLIE